jgi:hypothetical protein
MRHRASEAHRKTATVRVVEGRREMSALIDDISRVIASPISRRKAVRLVGGAVGGAVLSSLGLGRASRALGAQASNTVSCSGNQVLCNGKCYPKGYTCCGSRVCGSADKCCPGGYCCDTAQTCCGRACCARGETCCNGRCYPSTYTCCGGGVCDSDDKCCPGGYCCEKTQVCCGARCCPPGYSCCKGKCVQTRPSASSPC